MRCVVVACVLLVACSKPEPPTQNVEAELKAYWQEKDAEQAERAGRVRAAISTGQDQRVERLERRVNQLEKDRIIDQINERRLP